MADKPVDNRYWLIESKSEPGYFAVCKFRDGSQREALLTFTDESKAAAMRSWLEDGKQQHGIVVPVNDFPAWKLHAVLDSRDTEKVVEDLAPGDRLLFDGDWLAWQSLDDFFKSLES